MEVLDLKSIRIIVVDGLTYEWRFSDSIKDGKKYYYLLMRPEENVKSEVLLRFFCQGNQEDDYLLQEGFLTVRDQQKVMLNLNQPKFVAELIYFLTHHKELIFTKNKRYTFDNGVEVLREMGYRF